MVIVNRENPFMNLRWEDGDFRGIPPDWKHRGCEGREVLDL